MDSQHGPTYVSNRNAEGILSDIRPIKFTSDGLKSTNVFLDELLYSVLAASRSLLTSQIKIGLLKVLPTALGKEALLEAEMELRSYIDRTGPPPTTADTSEFHLQWSFELLRLKCEAYSTLSDSDEDAQAEAHLNERMSRVIKNVSPPKANLVAPAALYLTAVIESVCEHVLINVGRVAARDSSRSSATVADLFTALCEDDSIFAFFRTMKVFEKIESLALLPRPRRSKSFTRSNDTRNSPTHSMNPSVSGVVRSRNSSESHSPMAAQATRTSIDKTRGLKMFKSNGKTTSELGEHNHKRTASAASDTGRGSIAASDYGDSDFEDMMRSGSTMKMSLTPDRLRTMESIKDKSLKGKRSLSKASLKSPSKPAEFIPPTPELPRQIKADRPTQLILEDEEESSPARSGYNARPRPVSPPPTAMQSARTRSLSAIGGNTTTYISPNSSLAGSPSMVRQRSNSIVDSNGQPARTRRVQRNIEDADLDDVMGGSDDERTPTDGPRSGRKTASDGLNVSATTKDLIDFLASGPPEEPRASLPRSGSGTSLGSTKSTSRLGRMLSKLSIKKSNEKLVSRYSGAVESTTPPRRTSPSNMGPPPSSYPGINGAPNYVKPTPPRPITQPSSPAPSHRSFEVRDYSAASKTNEVHASPALASNEAAVTGQNVILPASSNGGVVSAQSGTTESPSRNGHTASTNGRSTKVTNGDVSKREAMVVNGALSNDPVPSPVRQKSNRAGKHRTSDQDSKAVPKYFEYAHDLRKLMSKATTVDECRLLVEIFLAKSGVRHTPARLDSLEATIPVEVSATVDSADVELAIVELLLGGCKQDLSDLQTNSGDNSTVDSLPPDTPTDAEPINQHHEHKTTSISQNHDTEQIMDTPLAPLKGEIAAA